MHKNSFFNKLNLNNNKQNTRGITLIALVITIIILLILAGVSISMLTGQNGILTQAQKAKQSTEESTEKEKRQLSQVEASTHLENYDYTDAEGNTAKIPAGFAVSNVDGENLINTGLVIIGENGNEYVWIPCTINKSDTAKLQYSRETSAWGIEDDNKTIATRDELTLKNASLSSSSISDGITTEILNEIVSQVENEFTSIERNGGYYIGRYEVGIKNNIAILKQNQSPYINLKWVEAYQESKNIDVGNHSNSYLCSSYAWDTAIKFIQTHKTSINYGSSLNNFNENWTQSEVKDIFGSIIKPLNLGKLLNTGLTTSKSNIYDMGGNVTEFTTELNPNISAFDIVILRGGGYKYNLPAGYRSDIGSNSVYQYCGFYSGFRSTLFLK